jgi:hypothetical protein
MSWPAIEIACLFIIFVSPAIGDSQSSLTVGLVTVLDPMVYVSAVQ